MSVGSIGAERNTFGLVRRGDISLGSLPSIASPTEIETSDFVEIFVSSFVNNFLVCYADDAAEATTILTAKTEVIKVTGGQGAKIPVAGTSEKLFVAAETGGPHVGDLQIVKTRGT